MPAVAEDTEMLEVRIRNETLPPALELDDENDRFEFAPAVT